jgi:hypothetical protein
MTNGFYPQNGGRGAGCQRHSVSRLCSVRQHSTVQLYDDVALYDNGTMSNHLLLNLENWDPIRRPPIEYMVYDHNRRPSFITISFIMHCTTARLGKVSLKFNVFKA